MRCPLVFVNGACCVCGCYACGYCMLDVRAISCRRRSAQVSVWVYKSSKGNA